MPAVAAALLALLLAACQAGAPAATPSRPPTETPAPTVTVPPAPTVQPTPMGYPLELVDDEGTTVTLAARPERIVSLTPATTELLFALGAGARTVARGDFDDYPPEATELPGVATFTGVDHEALVALEPDLVLAGGNNFTAAADIERMRELGAPVLVLYAPTFAAVLDDIRLVGQAVGATDEAEAIVAQIEARAAEVAMAVEGVERPRVFYQIGSEPAIYGPAPESFIADMVELAGGEAITTGDANVFEISVEHLVAADPEVIVLGDAQYGVCPPDVAARQGWQTMTAVREGAIRPVNDTIVTRPGPRLGEGLAALALAIHPAADVKPPAGDVQPCPS